jgi:hypothetical protein
MGSVLRIVMAALSFGSLTDKIDVMRRRLVLLAAVGMIALMGAIGMLLWFSVALFIYCETQIGSALAAVVTAGAFLLVILVACLVAIFSSRPRRARPPPQLPYMDMLAELERFLRANKNSLLLASVVAGLVLSARRSRPR